MEAGYWNVLHRGFLVAVMMMRGLLLMVDVRQRLALRCLSLEYYGPPLLSNDKNEALRKELTVRSAK